MDYLKEERKRGEVVKCAQCGKEIYLKWFKGKDSMTFCGPCYFGKRRRK